MSFLMKLLSGPHLGAEVALDPGAYIVGSEDSCDLVLMDSSLAPKHCKLDVEDDVLTIVALDGVVWNGSKVLQSGESAPVVTGAIYRLGTTFVAFIREGEEWKEPASIPSLVVEAESGVEDEQMAYAETPIDQKIEERKTEEKSPDKKIAPKGKGLKIVFALFAGLLILIVAVFSVFRYYYSKNVSTYPVESSVSPKVEDIRTFLDTAGYSHLRVTEEGAGVFVISGVLASEERRSTLRKSLSDHKYSARLQVLTSDEVSDVITALLAATTAFDNKVKVSEDGVVRVYGYVKESRDIEKLQRMVKHDLPFDFLSIEWKLQTLSDVEKDLRKLLKEHHMEELQTKQLDRSVVLSGTISQALQEEYREVLKRFAAIYDSKLLKDEVKVEATPSVSSPPRLEIEAVVIGSKKFIITSSGQRMVEGDDAGNGYIIASIQDNKIILRCNDKEHVIPVTPSIVMQYTW